MFLFAATVAIVISSCKTPTGQAQRELEAEYIAKYSAKYFPSIAPKPSGLYFSETKAGVAADTLIKAGDQVKVYYRGYLITDDPTTGIGDGLEFDFAEQGMEPFTFTVGSGAVIAGWDEAMLYMKQGSEAKLLIPSKLAYSITPQGSIPAYSPLVFYISVYKVYHSTDTIPTIQLFPKGPISR